MSARGIVWKRQASDAPYTSFSYWQTCWRWYRGRTSKMAMYLSKRWYNFTVHEQFIFLLFLNLVPMDLGISSPTVLPCFRLKNCSKSLIKLKRSASTCSIHKTTALLHVPVFLMTRNSHHGNFCPRLTGSLNEPCMWVPIKSTKSLSFPAIVTSRIKEFGWICSISRKYQSFLPIVPVGTPAIRSNVKACSTNKLQRSFEKLPWIFEANFFRNQISLW